MLVYKVFFSMTLSKLGLFKSSNEICQTMILSLQLLMLCLLELFSEEKRKTGLLVEFLQEKMRGLISSEWEE